VQVLLANKGNNMPLKSKNWLKAKIHSIIELTEQTWKFSIKFDKDFIFVPGQFITIRLRGITRSYSIASFSKNKDIIELIIVRVENGKLTSILFRDVKVGERLEVKGPIGNFILPKDINRDIFFICTGTGLAPFKSILDEVVISGNFPKRIFLIFGTRKKSDLLFYDELISLSKINSNFKYIPVLSRENWDGKTGYVHDQYYKIVKEEKLQNPLFYLCGWRNMIVDAKAKLNSLGVKPDNIKLELFG